jgi:hypothetical protein
VEPVGTALGNSGSDSFHLPCFQSCHFLIHALSTILRIPVMIVDHYSCYDLGIDSTKMSCRLMTPLLPELELRSVSFIYLADLVCLISPSVTARKSYFFFSFLILCLGLYYLFHIVILYHNSCVDSPSLHFLVSYYHLTSA